MKKLKIKPSAIDACVPKNAEVVFRLMASGTTPRVIGDYNSAAEAQERSDTLGIAHFYVTWWRDKETGRQVQKHPALDSCRHFLVRVPYTFGVSDAKWMERIRSALPDTARVQVDSDRNNRGYKKPSRLP